MTHMATPPVRRRIVGATLLFCAATVTYILILGDHDSRLHETIVVSCFGLCGVVIPGFLFGEIHDTNTNID